MSNGTSDDELPAIVSYVPPNRYKCHRITTGVNPAICIDWYVRGEVFRAILPFAEVDEFLQQLRKVTEDERKPNSNSEKPVGDNQGRLNSSPRPA